MPKWVNEPVSCVFAIDKPRGMIVMDLIRLIKPVLADSPVFRSNEQPPKKQRRGRFNTLKIGQGGTLDPLAEGVLVIGINKGTKKLGDFLHGTKGYDAVGLLGCQTTSDDFDGEQLVRTKFAHVTKDSLAECLPKLRGDIQQVPPLYSSLLMDGKRLYEYAREGLPLPREIALRQVHVARLDLAAFDKEHTFTYPEKVVSDWGSSRTGDGIPIANESHDPEDVAKDAIPPCFSVSMDVSSGTYVRSLVRDIGLAAGSSAFVVKLVRTQQGNFVKSETHKTRDDQIVALPWSLFEEAIDQHQQLPRPERSSREDVLPWEETLLARCIKV